MDCNTQGTTTPDKAEADWFLTRLDEYAETFCFCAFDDTANGLPPITGHGTLDKVWPRLVERNLQGYGIFVAVNEVPDGLPRVADNVSRVRAVFRDWDTPEQQRKTLPLDCITIESSPGKYHEYLLADGLPLDAFKPVQKVLITEYGSDKSVHDLPRVMRLPGTVNNKPEAGGHVVRLVSDDHPATPYTAARIVAAFPPARENKKAQQAAREPMTEERWAEVQDAITAIPAHEYDTWLEVGQALHSTGHPEALSVWDTWSQGADNYPGRAELEAKWGTFTAGKGITIKTLFALAIENDWTPPNLATLQARVAELAKLSALEYDQRRDAVAKELGVRVGTLDKEVSNARGEAEQDKAGKQPLFSEVQPWPEAVDLCELLNEIRTELKRYLVLPQHADTALALWVVFTWVYDTFDACPLVLLTSPEKRSGKTRTLDVLSRMARKPLSASNISPASLFRVVEHAQPTLMIDEADQFLTDNPELTGIINSGFTRSTAQVARCEGDNHDVKIYSTWSPKCIAMIRLPFDTIVDRSILVPMARKTKAERVAKLRQRTQFPELKQKLQRFADDNQDALAGVEPALPGELDDRACDKWEPLLAIADLAGNEWPEQSRVAAVVLSKTDEEESRGIELLRDCKAVIPQIYSSQDGYVTTSTLIDALCKIETSPWLEYWKGNPITPRQLSRLLKPFGIKPATVGPKTDRKKGYRVSHFEPVWERYLS